MKTFIRNLQTYFPGLQDARFATQKKLRSLTGTYYEEDYSFFRYFENINTYLDIGANRGDTIHDVSRLLPNSQIIGFEPNVSLYDKLIKQTSGNKNVTIHNTGLANSVETKEFYLPKYRNYTFDGLGSFDYENAVGLMKHVLPNLDPNLLSVDKHKFKVKKLDDFDLKPDFIKMDVQGYEYFALLGGEQTIAQNKPILLIEAPEQNCIDFLSNMGYIQVHSVNGKLKAGKGDPNSFFFNKEKLGHFINDLSIIEHPFVSKFQSA